MGIEALSLDPANLPSFSRIGKNYSNEEGTASIQRSTERDRKLTRRGRSEPRCDSVATCNS
eukprot:2038327-Rhodomonas_salina.1